MAPAPTLAERLAAAPTDRLSVADIASVTGLSEQTVRRLTQDPQWPGADGTGDRGEQRFERDACAQWMRDHQAARVDVTELPGADTDRVTITDIAHRTGIPRATISPMPAKYKDSNDPFPAADVLSTYNWGEVKSWLGRRSSRTGPRGTTAVPVPAEVPTTTPVLDVLTTAMIERLTGRGKEAVKTLVRRPEIADLSSGKVGRSRVWPAAALLPVLWRLGYLPETGPLSLEQTAVLVELGYLPAKGKPTPEQAAVLLDFGYDPKGTVEHRAWLAGPLRSATELAAHYGVTISAVSRRLSRARDAGEPVPTPIDTEDGKRYDPRVFDNFWK
ncbi:helix-turn-helix transcriptional regulator [Kitasatospora sp. NPDC056446]|uniref:helix-turn-helix transcriptional regulator n=1 Tax=Kitasatospora sp. NPDC056446 TaxID=3345819 RepID=UPI0036CB8D2B